MTVVSIIAPATLFKYADIDSISSFFKFDSNNVSNENLLMLKWYIPDCSPFILDATKYKIGSFPIGGFVNDKIIELLDLTEDELPIYVIGFGSITK